MSTKPKSKQEEALQLLDDLDSLAPPDGAPAPAQGTQPPAEGEAEVYAFIDEITQKSTEHLPRLTAPHIDRPLSRAGTPTLRKTERVKVGAPAPLLPSAAAATPNAPISGSSPAPASSAATDSASTAQAQAGSSGWGWGNVWSSASAAIQQAKQVVDEQVKNLPNNEQARKVLEYAKAAQLEKLGNDFKRVGLSTLTDILNVVAPPISEHEVIQIWLSHDMTGYEGVESLVYRAFARILEQVEGGDLVVNRGDESRPKETSGQPRDLNTVEGLEAAMKLAQANLEELIKRNTKPPPSQNAAQNPTTYSYVYLRVQPFMTSLPLPQSASEDESTPTAPESQSSLQFLLYMSDPAHQLTHSTVTQAVPGKWLELWDEYDWVEDLVVEAIRVGVEVIGQEYIVSRMGWDKKSASAPGTEAHEESEEKAQA